MKEKVKGYMSDLCGLYAQLAHVIKDKPGQYYRYFGCIISEQLFSSCNVLLLVKRQKKIGRVNMMSFCEKQALAACINAHQVSL